jgi:ankyrin repeat protein
MHGVRKNKLAILFFLGLLLVISGCRHTTQSPETQALLRAAREGHADAVEELLKTPGIEVNARDESGNTALLEAARFGHDHVARVLLAAGADVKMRDKDGKTPLMLAVAGGHDEVVRVLRQAGARE